LSLNLMLTRPEVIAQLKRTGVIDSCLRKMQLQDFEKYMKMNHVLKIRKEPKIWLKREDRPKLDSN
jgi:hypothetical protein